MSPLPIRRRVHVAPAAPTTTAAFVRCPEDGRWAPLEACRHCTKCVDVGETLIVCHVPAARAGSTPEEAAVAEAIEPRVVCVDGSLPIGETLGALDEHEASLAVVLDASGHPIGVVTRDDLVPHSPSRRVETVVPPLLIALLERASVADAIELIAERGIAHVPILGAGRIVGVVTGRSIIRWLTQSLQAARTGRGRRVTPP